jgi:hypothetical protein
MIWLWIPPAIRKLKSILTSKEVEKQWAAEDHTRRRAVKIFVILAVSLGKKNDLPGCCFEGYV